MESWWIVVVLAAGGWWWWLRRSARAKSVSLQGQGMRPQSDAAASSSEAAPRMGDRDPARAPVQTDPYAGSAAPGAPPMEVVGVTKTEVMCALKADVPNGFRKAQELLIAARRYLKETESSGAQPQPEALEPMRQACHALAAALGEDGWMPAHEIAGDEAAAISAFLQRFELAFQNWQSEYALLREFLPRLPHVES